MNQPTGKTLDPGLRRSLLIIGGVLGGGALVLALVLMLKPSSKSADAASVSIASTSSAGVEKDGPMTPHQQALLQEKQRAEAEEAARRGKVYIPPDSAAAEPLPAAASGPGLSPAQQYMAPPPNTQIDPMEQERQRMQQDRLRKGLDAQLQQLMVVQAPPAKPERIQFTNQAPSSPDASGANRQVAGATAGADGREAGVEVVDGLEIFAAQTASPVDTYKTGYVSARIVSGRLAGAFLTGRTQMVNEGLQPRFTAMRFNGRTYKVNAIALDEATATDAVSAKLDRRYLQRYVMPVMMAMVGGYAQAKSQPSQESVPIGGGAAAVVTNSPTERQAVAAGVAAAVQMGQRAVDAEANLPIRATLAAGTSIGIMFLEKVMDTDNAAQALRAGAEQDARERAAAAAAFAPRFQAADAAPPAGRSIPAGSTINQYAPQTYGDASQQQVPSARVGALPGQ